MKLDENCKKENLGMDAGCTSNVVYLNQEHIFCANAGDSRSVLFSGSKVVALSEDHKPDNEEELKRI